MFSVTLSMYSEAAESGHSGELESDASLLVGVCCSTRVATVRGSAIAEIGDRSLTIGSAFAESGDILPLLFSGRLVGAGPVRSMIGVVAIVGVVVSDRLRVALLGADVRTGWKIRPYVVFWFCCRMRWWGVSVGVD